MHSFVFQVDHHAKDVCIGAISRNFKHYSSGTLGVGEHAKHSYGITPKSKHPSQDRRSSSSSSQHSRDSAYAPFESGDLVRMTVNLDKKTISYAVNGIDYGVAFEDVDSELCPAVSFASSGAQVTLLVGSPTYRCEYLDWLVFVLCTLCAVAHLSPSLSLQLLSCSTPL